MGKYTNMRTISDLKAQIKIAAFYFIDLVFLVGTFMLGQYLQQKIGFKTGTYILFQAVNLSLCFYLCMPSFSNKTRNNFSLILLFLRRDQRQFLSHDFKFIKKKGGH